MIALTFMHLRLGGKRPRKRLRRTGPTPKPTLPEVRRIAVFGRAPSLPVLPTDYLDTKRVIDTWSSPHVQARA